MQNPTLAVVAFPGNNCETETARAAQRNGFEAEIVRWNEVEKIGSFDAYILPGGFSFEDRGRAGAIAAREAVFDALREEAKRGKVILGICNGAQMIVESGLIPVGENPLPCALADNVRRDTRGHVMGTGYYNVWSHLKVERTDTAFTQGITGVTPVPIAHGEGRFTTISETVEKALESGSHVAFRYCDKAGTVSSDYPTTPNGAAHAVAMLVNQEGTVGAIMPHPERFPFECAGFDILKSMRTWILAGASPEVVTIGDLTAQSVPELKPLTLPDSALVLEKSLIITDNEAFSVSEAAQKVAGAAFSLDKSWVYVLEGDVSMDAVVQTGLVANPNKESLVLYSSKPQQYLVELREDDPALHLADQLTEVLGTAVTVRRYKAWTFGAAADQAAIDMVLANGLLCNPNSGRLRVTNQS